MQVSWRVKSKWAILLSWLPFEALFSPLSSGNRFLLIRCKLTTEAVKSLTQSFSADLISVY